jgi:N-acetylmuramoyl-L-alanine amidase
MYSPNCSGTLVKPEFIIVHFTASGDFASTKAWLCDKRSKVSAHYLIGRNEGEFAQLVPLEKCAWHAGVSAWEGKTGLNRYSIGIELVSWGPLTDDGRNIVNGAKVPENEIVTSPHPTGGKYTKWQGYTTWQLSECCALLAKMWTDYPSLREVLGHMDVAPGRKLDPWPLEARALTPQR